MDMTIKVNLLDPNARDALRALLAVLDQKDEAAPKKPQGRAPDEPAAGAVQTPAKPVPAAPSPAATEPATQPPAEGDGEAVLTAAQRDEVIRLQTERVQDVDEARTALKSVLSRCYHLGSLSQLEVKWLPDVLEYVRTGKEPEELPF